LGDKGNYKGELLLWRRREEGKHGGYGGKRKKFKQKEARCQIGEKEKDTKRQSALWRIGRRRMEKNWSFCKGDLVLHWTT
jgi:hypothetical protein